jgi:hypothetical protein
MSLFDNIVNSILKESANISGGIGSAFGPGVGAEGATQFSADTYARGDARIVKPLSKGVITRNGVVKTVFSTGKKSKKKHSRRRKHKRK